MSYLGNTPVTVMTAPFATLARDGSLYRDWANAVSITYQGNMLEPFQLSSRLQVQKNQDREFASSYGRLWMVPEADMQPGQRVVVHGVEYDVHGSPIPWYDLEDVRSHWTVLVLVRSG